MRIRCTTKFDITTTGVTGHHKPSRIPFTDKSGQAITCEADWNRARNQQRNYETVLQLVSLRTQIDDVAPSVRRNGQWEFEFTVENSGIFFDGEDTFGTLKSDCHTVPMITDLSEQDNLNTILIPDENIWFETINN